MGFAQGQTEKLFLRIERPTNSTEEFDVVSKQMTNLAGSSHTESRQGMDVT